MENKNISDLINTCKEILSVSSEHAYLWEDPSLWGEQNSDMEIKLFSGFIAQDEMYFMNIKKIGKRFAFSGRNFYLGEQPNLRDAAKFMRDCDIPAEQLRKRFYESLEEPLGRYLAREHLKNKERNIK